MIIAVYTMLAVCLVLTLTVLVGEIILFLFDAFTRIRADRWISANNK
jgi:hypothetical protein